MDTTKLYNWCTLQFGCEHDCAHLKCWSKVRQGFFLHPTTTTSTTMGLDDKLSKIWPNKIWQINKSEEWVSHENICMWSCMWISTQCQQYTWWCHPSPQPQPQHQQTTPQTPTNTTINNRWQWTTPMPLMPMTVMSTHSCSQAPINDCWLPST